MYISLSQNYDTDLSPVRKRDIGPSPVTLDTNLFPVRKRDIGPSPSRCQKT